MRGSHISISGERNMMGRKYTADLSWTLLTQITTAVVGVLTVYIVSRMFSTEEYGHFYLIKRVSDLTWLVLLAGTTVSIPRNKVFLDKANEGLIEKFIFVLAPVSILVFFICSKWISLFFLDSLHGQYYHSFIFMVIGLLLFGITYAYLRAGLAFKLSNTLQIVNYGLVPVLPLLFANRIVDYIYLYSQFLLAVNITAFTLITIINRNKIFCYEDFQTIKSGFIRILSYGILRLPGLLLAGLIFTAPVTFLNWMGMEKEVGLLGQIFQLLSIVNLPINSIGLVLLPNMAKLIAEKELHTAQVKLNQMMKTLQYLTIPLAILILLFSPKILTLINGYEILFSDIYYGFIFLGIIPLSFYNLLRNPLDAISAKPYSTFVVSISIFISLGIGANLYFFTELNHFLLILTVCLVVFVLLGTFSILLTRRLYFFKNYSLTKK